jgi:4-hydroxy-tetrahydrodipicolinate reductase
MIRAVIIGVTGRMGAALVRAAAQTSDFRVTGAVASQNSASLGLDAGELAGIGSIGVAVTCDLSSALAAADVAIDFSSGQATAANVAACRKARKALLIGTTGYASQVERDFKDAAADIALLVASNTSVGVTLLIELVREAARALPATFDIEIIEAHHRAKRDAPSGTALALGNAAASGRKGSGQVLSQAELVSSERISTPGPRHEGEIGFAVVRGGDIVGEHTVLFAGNGERLSLSHCVTDRAIFARGAVQAARWLLGRPAGRYTMSDFIGYKSEA